eukprot:7377172-Prymnesium_polylepis.1
MLAENCFKTATAVGSAVDAFVEGRHLSAVTDMDSGVSEEDELHTAYREVITSRTAFEDAASAARWENRVRGEWDIDTYRNISRADRRIVYGVVAIDQLLRVPELPPPSPGPSLFQRTLTEPLQSTSELMQAVLCRIAYSTAHRRRASDAAGAAPAPFMLRRSIDTLQSALASYVQAREATTSANFTRHAAVVQLLIDTALRVEGLQQAADRAIPAADDSVRETTTNEVTPTEVAV